MTTKQRIDAFTSLGTYLLSDDPILSRIIDGTKNQNAWFTVPNVRQALANTAANLTVNQLENWLAPYDFDDESDKTVGLILAGNIPLVGFHDILCALCAGFNIQVKPSADDPVLTAHCLAKLQEIEPAFAAKISVVERLTAFDLVIATGNNNSARYFMYYFGKYPHIIRKNRNSVAVLSGQETASDFKSLGHDVFDYFGLGCRNVSKLFVPDGYNIATFFEGIAGFSDVINHHKYANNYDYSKSMYLVNGDVHYDNGFLLVKPDVGVASPLAVLNLELYRDSESLAGRLAALASRLQCVVSGKPLPIATPVVGFGDSQAPALDDYADGINTLDFLAMHR